VRVAIYTRQSVDRSEGGDFGSIEAQKEVVQSFIGSKRALGWQALPAGYDDLGFSGATTERPAFQRLLADIEAGKVDVVAVYRLDRFSRSLLDFARLMAFLQERNVEFASVSEQFDTSSPMGRMVLNLLATFAQFERETIAQRTRDKIIATRRRGGWTGGRPILGLDSKDGHLLVNEEEAEQVRDLFRLYLELGSLGAVADEAQRRGWTCKRWTNGRGEAVGGGPLTKANLYDLFGNVLLMGKIRADGEIVDGAHEAVVDERTWHRVQRQLLAHGQGRRKSEPWRKPHPSWLLRGLAKCGRCGSSMTCQKTGKGSKRHRYYVCAKMVKQKAAACPGSRTAAGPLEDVVAQRLLTLGQDPVVLEAVLAADREQREKRVPELEAELRKLRAESGRLEEQRRNLVRAIQQGSPSAEAITRKADELSREIATAHERIEAVANELYEQEDGAIDPEELARVLGDLGPVWAALTPIERSRMVSLLVERIDVDVPGEEIEITFRPGTPETLLRQGGEVVW
jgi:site-specific DNA recombinase